MEESSEQTHPTPVMGTPCPACAVIVSMAMEDGTPLPQQKGYVILCQNCGAELEIVQLEPTLRFELLQESK